MAPGVQNGHVPAVVTWSYCRCVGVLGAWRRLRPSSAFSTEHGVLEILKDKQQFLQHENSFKTVLWYIFAKILFQKSFWKKIKFKSLEDSEEHCSVVCKLPFHSFTFAETCTSTFMVWTHPAAVIPARCRIIS